MPRREHAPQNAMDDAGEIAAFYDHCSDLMRELLDGLAAAPDRPRPFPAIEDAIGWPRRRIASVLGGAAQLRHTRFGGRRPYRFHDARDSASGRWEMWMDAVQARVVRGLLGMEAMRVTVWGENVHEQTEEDVRARYPRGMHGAIADGIAELLGDSVEVGTATLQEPEHGLSQAVLDDTDVLTWWGHVAHEEVDDAVVERVHDAVLGGMGLVALHSAHYSKIFRRLLGTSCSLRYRNDGERELVWTVDPAHPIAAGVPHPIVLDAQEMYGEHFDIPAPDELVFLSTFAGGEVFRSGCCFRRGVGRIFYFSPGDQDYPVYHHADVRHVIANAVRWAAPAPGIRRAVADSAKSPRGWFEAS